MAHQRLQLVLRQLWPAVREHHRVRALSLYRLLVFLYLLFECFSGRQWLVLPLLLDRLLLSLLHLFIQLLVHGLRLLDLNRLRLGGKFIERVRQHCLV